VKQKTRAKGKKVKAKGKLETAPRPFPEHSFDKSERNVRQRYDFGLTDVSAKKNWFKYRDKKTGRYVSKDRIASSSKVRMELWRYSPTGEFRFKMLWREKKYSHLQKARPIDREREILRAFYRRNRSRFVFDKLLGVWIAFTRSG
jgi:hypothetical protein